MDETRDHAATILNSTIRQTMKTKSAAMVSSSSTTTIPSVTALSSSTITNKKATMPSHSATTTTTTIPSSHPRAESLYIRHKLVKGFESGLVATEGLLAHGRGEAFDYLLGEKTSETAKNACMAAAATLHLADKPVISVNGNAAALCAKQLVKIAKYTDATLEINLFYDNDNRRTAIAECLRKCGAMNILGINSDKMTILNGTDSARRMVDVDGIMAADVVLVPLEDGDRTRALKQAKKTVITFDLNPLSRTAQAADISIIDNITRASDILAKQCHNLASTANNTLENIRKKFDNKENLQQAIEQINSNLQKQHDIMIQNKNDGDKK